MSYKLASPPNLRQILVATAVTLDHFQGVMTPFERDEEGLWHQVWDPFPIVFGQNGMAWGEEALHLWGRSLGGRNPLLKQEGDKRSPIGCFPLLRAFGTSSPSSTRMPYDLTSGLEGVDDPTSRYYNRLVRRETICDVDWKSSEKMQEQGEIYARGLVIGYNFKSPKPYAGSCIFIHVWRSFEEGTAGCIAMEKQKIEKILTWLDPDFLPHIVQCPRNVYEEFLEEGALPLLRTP